MAARTGETERATLTERLAGKEDQLRELREALDRETDQNEFLRTENARTLANLSALQTRLEEERKASQEKLALLNNAEEKLADAFKALSADALRNNNRSFLDLAKQNLETFQQTAKGDLERRQSAIDELIKPLKESLEKVDGKIGELEKTRAGAYSELREQVKALAQSHLQLQSETGNLVKALRVPHVRGRWGEIQLRRVVELAGMLQYCDFVEQETFATEDSRIRPDVIVRLPGNRTIVVDSKVPFDAFYESISTTDEEVRASQTEGSRATGKNTHHDAQPQVVLGNSATDAGVCVAVSSRRNVLQCRARKRSEVDRRRRQPGRDHRHADDADRVAESGLVRLASGADGGERAGSEQARAESLRSPAHVYETFRRHRQRISIAHSTPTTKACVHLNLACS